jgi:hypothetical protein
MKGAREHRVPLSSQALAILEEIGPKKSGPIFPGTHGDKPLSNMALLMTLRRMNRADLTAHGFRSTFRDWTAETTDFPGEVAEAALAHAVGEGGWAYGGGSGGTVALAGDLCCAAPTLRVLQPSDFWNFARFMIRAVETADKPYAAFVATGLSPFGWDPEPTTNQLRSVPAFLRELETVADETSRTPDSLEVWQEAWSRRRIPGYKSAEDFWRSPLGTALRLRTPTRRVAVETVSPDSESCVEAGDTASRGPVAFKPPTKQEVADMVKIGVLGSYDAWLLYNLVLGKTLKQLARHPRTLLRFKAPHIPDAFISELAERIANYRKHR